MTVGYDEFVEKLNILEETTMKSLFEQLGGTYSKQSDYLIPNLTLPNGKENDVGIYGQRYLQYLQEYCKLSYINLLTSGDLMNIFPRLTNKHESVFFRL